MVFFVGVYANDCTERGRIITVTGYTSIPRASNSVEVRMLDALYSKLTHALAARSELTHALYSRLIQFWPAMTSADIRDDL